MRNIFIPLMITNITYRQVTLLSSQEVEQPQDLVVCYFCLQLFPRSQSYCDQDPATEERLSFSDLI